MNIRDYAIHCIKDEAQAVLDLIPQLDEHFDRAVELMLHCKGKIIVTGVGKSGHIGAKIAATLSSTGTPAFYINPLDVFHGDLGVMTADDVVLAMSNSGQTDELLRFIPMVLHMNIPIIGMSSNPQSLLAKYSTEHILVKVSKEACPLNLKTDKFDNGSTRHWRCTRDSPYGIAPFQTARLRTVPSGRRIGKTTTDNSCRRDEDGRVAYHPERDAPGTSHHRGKPRHARTRCLHRRRTSCRTHHRR